MPETRKSRVNTAKSSGKGSSGSRISKTIDSINGKKEHTEPKKVNAEISPKRTPKKRKAANLRSKAVSPLANVTIGLKDGGSIAKRSKVKKVMAENRSAAVGQADRKVVSRFLEDDNFIDVEVTDDLDDFPDCEGNISSQETESDASDGEVEIGRSSNNNATRVQSANYEDTRAGTSTDNRNVQFELSVQQEVGASKETPQPTLVQSFNMMQDFMLHKGLIEREFGQDDMQEFLQGANNWSNYRDCLTSQPAAVATTRQGEQRARDTRKEGTVGHGSKYRPQENLGNVLEDNSSVTTIYRPAVKQTGTQVTPNPRPAAGQNISSSSDELVDTSDEFLNNSQLDGRNDISLTEQFIADCRVAQGGRQAIVNRSQEREQQPQQHELTTEERVAEPIKEAEGSCARMYDLPGKTWAKQSISSIDEDYQMVDSHVDANTRAKMVNFEFVNLARLLL